MPVKETDRFETAAEWIRASVGPERPQEYVDACARICKRRGGIWSVVRTRPSPSKDLARTLIYDAFHAGRHAAIWDSLGAWTEKTTGALIEATDEERALFEMVYENTYNSVRERSGNA